MSLEAMISLCEQRVEEEEKTRERKRQLEHSLSDAAIRMQRTREELKSIGNDQSNWSQEWASGHRRFGPENGCPSRAGDRDIRPAPVFF